MVSEFTEVALIGRFNIQEEIVPGVAVNLVLVLMLPQDFEKFRSF